MTSDNLCKWPACLKFSVYNCPGRGKKLSWRSVSLDWVSSRSRSCCRISWRPERNREEQMRNSRYCRHTRTDTRIHAFCPGLSVCVCVWVRRRGVRLKRIWGGWSRRENSRSTSAWRRRSSKNTHTTSRTTTGSRHVNNTHTHTALTYDHIHWQQTCKQHTHTALSYWSQPLIIYLI